MKPRAHKRLPVEMWVDETHEDATYFQRSGNLSLGGMYLDGTIPLACGTIVQLRFTLPGEKEPVETRGEVVGAASEKKLGQHVKFVDIEDDKQLRARLTAFLTRAGDD
jgi:hypothetical protein